MPVIPAIAEFAEDLVAIRHDLHAHPEIGFEERRTAAVVAEALRSWGIGVTEGVGGTGVVGVLKGERHGTRRIGLRADMDALAMDETADVPYRSLSPGKFHGCGHDGHTTMLLGAARYLAATRDFAGTATFIFQPAEEGLGGAQAMIADNLFKRFPCDEVYGLHNSPELELGQVLVFPGQAMAGASFFDITIHGRGSHGAMPNHARDPIVVATALVQGLQSVVSRNLPPLQAGVLSVTQIHGGSAYNVIPEDVTLAGTMRYFDDATADLIMERTRLIAAGVALAFDVTIEVDIREIYSVLVNHPEETVALRDAAAGVTGWENLMSEPRPSMGSEDFADMLRAVPGAYCWVGHGGSVAVHNPAFVLDDNILPIGASILARLVEARLA